MDKMLQLTAQPPGLEYRILERLRHGGGKSLRLLCSKHDLAQAKNQNPCQLSSLVVHANNESVLQ